MRSLVPVLRRRRPPAVVVECRHCGTNVEESPDACPTCGADGFARYEIRG